MDAHDFILDDTGDIQFTASGDIAVGWSDRQHMRHIIDANPGYYREHPFCGCAIRNYMYASGAEGAIKRLINVQLKADNYDSIRVDIRTGAQFQINVDAERTF